MYFHFIQLNCAVLIMQYHISTSEGLRSCPSFWMG